jgi:16S rRNA U1498 N3-methylase RsmE
MSKKNNHWVCLTTVCRRKEEKEVTLFFRKKKFYTKKFSISKRDKLKQRERESEGRPEEHLPPPLHRIVYGVPYLT